MKSKKNHKYLNRKWTVSRVTKEIDDGFKLLDKVDAPIITVLGSHKSQPNSKYYKHAYKLAHKLGSQGFAIVTGGGPGIMEAANKGASDAKAVSIGIRAELLGDEKVDHVYFTKRLSYYFLFVRRFVLSLKSGALVFYPGGFGTLNEFFEYVVLIQLAFTDKIPVICVDRKYWEGLFKWLRTAPKKEGFYIDEKKDLGIVQFADTPEEVIKIIKKAGL